MKKDVSADLFATDGRSARTSVPGLACRFLVKDAFCKCSRHESAGGAEKVFELFRPDLVVVDEAHHARLKDPATEVWVYNAPTKARIKRVRLVRPGSSISLTHGAEPLWLVQAGERLDVYDPSGGSLVRSLDLPGLHTRMQIEPVR